MAAPDRATSRALVILAMQALADALYKNETITDDGIALQALKAGAESATAIVRDLRGSDV